MSDDIYLTPEGAQKLREELDNLINVARPDLAARLRAAIQMGDLSENADYHAAKQEQGFLEGRILEIEDKLRRAVIIDTDSRDTSIVQIGHKVTVLVDGEDDEESYQIVGTAEADPRKQRISYESPMGRAIIGHKVGDWLAFDTPNGKLGVKIVKIEIVK